MPYEEVTADIRVTVMHIEDDGGYLATATVLGGCTLCGAPLYSTGEGTTAAAAACHAFAVLYQMERPHPEEGEGALYIKVNDVVDQGSAVEPGYHAHHER
jgi:hypothetical protein